jgi:hypothetical protein
MSRGGGRYLLLPVVFVGLVPGLLHTAEPLRDLESEVGHWRDLGKAGFLGCFRGEDVSLLIAGGALVAFDPYEVNSPALAVRQTIPRMLQATFWPGPAPVWPALAMALVESECMVMCCHSLARIPGTTGRLALSPPVPRRRWFVGCRYCVGPQRRWDLPPLSSPVIIQPKPAASTEGTICPRVA